MLQNFSFRPPGASPKLSIKLPPGWGAYQNLLTRFKRYFRDDNGTWVQTAGITAAAASALIAEMDAFRTKSEGKDWVAELSAMIALLAKSKETIEESTTTPVTTPVTPGAPTEAEILEAFTDGKVDATATLKALGLGGSQSRATIDKVVGFYTGAKLRAGKTIDLLDATTSFESRAGASTWLMDSIYISHVPGEAPPDKWDTNVGLKSQNSPGKLAEEGKTTPGTPPPEGEQKPPPDV